MNIQALALGQPMFLYMDGFYSEFNKDAIFKGRITSLCHTDFTVQIESGMSYRFYEEKNFIYQDDLYPHINFIPFESEEEIYKRKDALEMASMLNTYSASGFTMLNLTSDVMDDIRFVYNFLFSFQPAPLAWTSLPSAVDEYKAIDKTAAYLAIYCINKSNEHWIVKVSCSANSRETYHGREYEFSSMEHSLEEAKRQATMFQRMISTYVHNDLRHI